MIPDAAFSSFVPTEVSDSVHSVGAEFDAAYERAEVSYGLGRKYHRALDDYVRALHNCPYSPGVNLLQPTEYDSKMKERMREELARVQAEYDRIVDSVGGLLPLDPNEE